MLSDKEIRDEISTNGLIESANAALVQNCTYSLRVGAVFEPKTGAKQDQPPEERLGSRTLHWAIGPGECLIVKTKESLKIPPHLCAYYHPLNSLAQKGVLLINASVIEPGYEGALSCFLVNFSSREVELAPEDRIAKITFEKIDTAVQTLVSKKIEPELYEKNLSSSARKFERSFLGIGNIEEKAAKSARESVASSVRWGGIFLVFLLLFAQAEPLLSKYLWERIGVSPVSRRVEDAKLANEIELARSQLKAASEKLQESESLVALKKQISELTAEVAALRKSKFNQK